MQKINFHVQVQLNAFKIFKLCAVARKITFFFLSVVGGMASLNLASHDLYYIFFLSLHFHWILFLWISYICDFQFYGGFCKICAKNKNAWENRMIEFFFSIFKFLNTYIYKLFYKLSISNWLVHFVLK